MILAPSSAGRKDKGPCLRDTGILQNDEMVPKKIMKDYLPKRQKVLNIKGGWSWFDADEKRLE